MAKVSGPLMSMDASGSYAGTIVFSKWKGRNTVRQLVTPSNPHSTGQESARNSVRVVGASQRWANVTATVKSGKTGTDKARLTAAAPSGQAWNGFLSKSIIGKGGVNYAASAAAYNALQAGDKTAWNTAAAALAPAFQGVAQTTVGGAAGSPMPAGQAYFHYQSGLAYALGDAAPTATPPTYA